MPLDAQRWWLDMLDSIQELRDCERYHCRPSELEDENWHTVSRHRSIEAAEKRWQKAEREAPSNRGK